jgi:hypothetical protein
MVSGLLNPNRELCDFIPNQLTRTYVGGSEYIVKSRRNLLRIKGKARSSCTAPSGVFRGGGIVPWPPPLWLMENFFEGLEDRWTGGWPSAFRRIWAENWRKLEKVSKKGRQVGCCLKRSTDVSFPY